MFQTICPSPLGPLTLTSDGGALTGLWLPGTTPSAGQTREDLPVFGETRRWLDCYFAGEDPGATPPLAPEGTPFQQLIWQMLREIPYGALTTYGALAKRAAVLLGKERMSAQAVGGAVGRNPISILIPCHRVIGTDGSLTGYGGGLPQKQKLLLLEGFTLTAEGKKVPRWMM